MFAKAKTERARQERRAKLMGGTRFYFVCDNGSAVAITAPSLAGAKAVLREERPGVTARVIAEMELT